jgi:hypothetical protein
VGPRVALDRSGRHGKKYLLPLLGIEPRLHGRRAGRAHSLIRFDRLDRLDGLDLPNLSRLRLFVGDSNSD